MRRWSNSTRRLPTASWGAASSADLKTLLDQMQWTLKALKEAPPQGVPQAIFGKEGMTRLSALIKTSEAWGRYLDFQHQGLLFKAKGQLQLVRGSSARLLPQEEIQRRLEEINVAQKSAIAGSEEKALQVLTEVQALADFKKATESLDQLAEDPVLDPEESPAVKIASAFRRSARIAETLQANRDAEYVLRSGNPTYLGSTAQISEQLHRIYDLLALQWFTTAQPDGKDLLKADQPLRAQLVPLTGDLVKKRDWEHLRAIMVLRTVVGSYKEVTAAAIDLKRLDLLLRAGRMEKAGLFYEAYGAYATVITDAGDLALDASATESLEALRKAHPSLGKAAVPAKVPPVTPKPPDIPLQGDRW